MHQRIDPVASSDFADLRHLCERFGAARSEPPDGERTAELIARIVAFRVLSELIWVLEDFQDRTLRGLDGILVASPLREAPGWVTIDIRLILVGNAAVVPFPPERPIPPPLWVPTTPALASRHPAEPVAEGSATLPSR